MQACQVILIWEDGSNERWLPLDEHAQYQFDYYASALEALISGKPQVGWVAHKGWSD